MLHPLRDPARHWLRSVTGLFALLLAGGAVAAEPQKRPMVVPDTPDGHVPLVIETASPDAVALRIQELGGRVEHVFRVMKCQLGYRKTHHSRATSTSNLLRKAARRYMPNCPRFP